MGNCQAVEGAAMVIQHPNGKIERIMYWPITALQVMKSNPGHYVSLIIPLLSQPNNPKKTLRYTRVKLLRPTDTLLLGRAYRLVTSQVYPGFISSITSLQNTCVLRILLALIGTIAAGKKLASAVLYPFVQALLLTSVHDEWPEEWVNAVQIPWDDPPREYCILDQQIPKSCAKVKPWNMVENMTPQGSGIHGLYHHPDRQGSEVPDPATIQLSEELEQRLNAKWPSILKSKTNKDFWQSEYLKHGGGFTYEEYLEETLNLEEKIPASNVLAEATTLLLEKNQATHTSDGEWCLVSLGDLNHSIYELFYVSAQIYTEYSYQDRRHYVIGLRFVFDLSLQYMLDCNFVGRSTSVGSIGLHADPSVTVVIPDLR